MKNKKSLMFLGMILLVILLVNIASAEFWACFEKGQRIDYCNNYRPSRTYDGNYPLCMSVYKPAENCYIHGVWPKCNHLDPGICSSPGGNTTFDLTPPVLKIIDPLNGTISPSKQLFLNFSLNEVATVYYTDIGKGTGTWSKVCDKCAVGNPTYARKRSFAEGENKLRFKAVDVVNNVAYVDVKFIVDSVAPRIYTTLPKSNAFADGNFEVQFKEANPKKLTLYYGTDKVNLDLSKCYDSVGKKVCDISVDLSKYDGKKVLYYFEIEDIAGHNYKSRPTNVSVDTKFPVVKNLGSFYKINGRYVEFNLSIDEPNLEKVSFINTLNPRSTPSTLCTRLTNGYCYKKQNFIPGNYSLSIAVTDKAGHSIAIPANFKIA
jgi:hypothetical protein